MRNSWRIAAVALLFGAATAVFVSRPAAAVTFPVGEYHAGFLRGDWSRPQGAQLDPGAAGDDRASFDYRTLRGPGGLRLPVTTRHGAMQLAIRAQVPVRAALVMFAGGRPAGQTLLPPRRWVRATIEIPEALVDADGQDLGFALRPIALTRAGVEEEPALALDTVEAAAPDGVSLSASAVLLLSAVPVALVLLAALAGAGMGGAVGAGVLATGAVVVLARLAPLPLVLAVPRLGSAALVAGLATLGLLSRAGMGRAERVGLTALVVLGVLGHGSLVFLPFNESQNLEIYVHRTLDLAGVPWDYDSILRYGSQLPTASQPYGAATYALGEKALVPYSPFPNVFYYALHAVGLDLYWAMTVLNVVLAMAVAPWLWIAAARLWDGPTAWLATLLYVLDLAVWHHVGRVHAPAAFGGALCTAALLYLAARAENLDRRREVIRAGLLLALAVLGYSSSAVLVGLLGLVLVGLALADARGLSPAARRGVVAALVVGGAVSGILYYFHYVPGLLRGTSALEAEPDLVGVKTFFIFHNESRQNLRVWLGGYWVLLVAGLVAAPVALRRAAASARPVLVSWLAAWALLMLLKEPFLLPKLLRWAKEDQFLSPLLCLFVAAAVWALPRPWMRWAAAAVVLAGALWIQVNDFVLNASGQVIL